MLGPTNTGKTHLALERLAGYPTGMIGFPLRLLARENYDRLVRLKGKDAVALVTGEERIQPPGARWFVCTVEAMPLDREVDFLAVDEIQLAGDPDRGHVFTERLLTARGRYETMFMGADTIKPLLRRLVPSAEIIARPRFSTLTHTGTRKISRLPPRSAVVAFSLADVFEIAEQVRRQRGGAAVVLGALSPRARNAQVALYQNGEVDYMVATDAIGMGLNMDLDHVAFARLSKFDGRGPRALRAPEIAQIAGRAGRHMNDGTFGTTAEAGDLDPEMVSAIEAHRFDPLSAVWWRNDDLDFRSLDRLIGSLERPPPLSCLIRRQDADDHLALLALSRQAEIQASANSRERVRLLWDVCQIPDFRKVMSDQHARLLTQVFEHLSAPAGRLPEDWVAGQIQRLERLEGDIDALVQRIAHIRTWTYMTHRAGWIARPEHWQERTRAIEDRLSDALHERLTQRFVDRRSASLVRSLKEGRNLLARVKGDGEVEVEGHYVGALTGFRFEPDPSAGGEATRTLLAAANRVLRAEIERRARHLVKSGDGDFVLETDGTILWQGAPVGRLARGETPLAPKIEPITADFLEGEARESVRRRLDLVVRHRIAGDLGALVTLPSLPLGPAGRGLAYRLVESLGTLGAGAGPVELNAEDRKRLTGIGLRFGTETLYLAPLLKPRAVALRAVLWSVWRGLGGPAPVPVPGRLSVPAADLPDPAYAEAIGYRIVGPRAIRHDGLEKLAAALRRRSRPGPFTLDASIGALAGIPIAELAAVVAGLGYRPSGAEGQLLWAPLPRRRRPEELARAVPAPPVADHHPFAALAALRTGS